MPQGSKPQGSKYERVANGSVTKLDLQDAGGAWHTVWTGTDSTTPGLNDFSINFAATSYLVNGVKVYVNTNQNMSAREQ